MHKQRLRSPPIKARPISADEEEEEDEYADSFESFSSPTKPKAATAGGSVGGSVTGKGEEEGSEIDGISLAQFMQNHREENALDPLLRPLDGVSPSKTSDHILERKLGYTGGNEDVEAGSRSVGGGLGTGTAGEFEAEEEEEEEKVGNGEEKSAKKTQRGVKFSSDDGEDDDDEDEASRLLSKIRKGYSEAPSTKKRTPPPMSVRFQPPLQEASTAKQTKVSSSSKVAFKSIKMAQDGKPSISPEKMDYYKSLLSSSSKREDEDRVIGDEEGGIGKLVTNSDEENSRRVDALLAELLPHRAKALRAKQSQSQPAPAPAPGPLNGAKKAQALPYTAQQQYGLGVSTKTVEYESPGSMQPALESQVAALRKELKGRDERLQRVTEHSMQLSSHVDALKGEISQLHQRLRSAELELEAKEQRASDAARLRKKAVKKSAKMAAELEKYNDIVKAVERLQTREQALLEAVEALSGQNEDLIKKLKQSMAREIEASQARVNALSNAATYAAEGSPRAGYVQERQGRGGVSKRQQAMGGERLPELQQKMVNGRHR